METRVSRCWNYIGLAICIDAMWLTLPRWTNCSKPSISYPLLQVGKVRWPDIIRSLVLASLSEYRAIDSVTDQAYDIRVGEMLEERWQPVECFHPAMTLSNDLQESDLKGANAVDMRDFSLFSRCPLIRSRTILVSFSYHIEAPNSKSRLIGSKNHKVASKYPPYPYLLNKS